MAPVAGELRTRLCASLAPLFPGFLVCLQGLFEYDRLTPQSVLDLAMELREEGLPLNGFLYGASVEIAEQEIRVTVINGTHLLGQMKFGEMLAQQIERRTGVLPVVRLVDGAPQNALTVQPAAPEQPRAAVVFAQQKVPSKKKAMKIEGLELTDSPVKVLSGKHFQPQKLTALKDLGAMAAGKVTVWGDVFFTEQKGSKMKIYSVSITDYTGSISLKIRMNMADDGSVWEDLQNGDTLVVRGECTFDRYDKDYVIYPYDVLKVERKTREDTAEKKRVELHLHTKQSSMDGFCDPGGIVRFAHKMGHRAVAITDHGVVQGYPEAMLAADAIRKKDPDFKLIYGCEAYFVDDMVPVVYGHTDLPLSGSFVRLGNDGFVAGKLLYDGNRRSCCGKRSDWGKLQYLCESRLSHSRKSDGIDGHHRRNGKRCPHPNTGAARLFGMGGRKASDCA